MIFAALATTATSNNFDWSTFLQFANFGLLGVLVVALLLGQIIPKWNYESSLNEKDARLREKDLLLTRAEQDVARERESREQLQSKLDEFQRQNIEKVVPALVEFNRIVARVVEHGVSGGRRPHDD